MSVQKCKLIVLCLVVFQAIDRFGETCRSIASRLVTLKQIFDKTDLSISDNQETEHVLDVHGQMWFDVRDDINNAQMIGNTQLKCMKVCRTKIPCTWSQSNRPIAHLPNY